MYFDIEKSNGDVVSISSKSNNIGTFSIPILGRNTTNYAPQVATSLVHMLENFANDTPPANPTVGQIWYNNVTERLEIWPGGDAVTGWVDLTHINNLGGVDISPSPTAGEVLSWDGTNWVNGPSGSGPAGPPGPFGPRGYTGSIGATGFTGSRGLVGLMGFTGYTGSIGPVGPTGPTGPGGGFTGSRGFTGSAGPAGPIGPAGPGGGFTGSRGATGFTGSRGFTGSIGPTGPAGPSNAITASNTTASTNYFVLFTSAGTAQTPRIRTTSTAFTYNPGTGTLTSNGDIVAFSDIRLKKDVENITDAMPKLRKLNGITYRRKDNADSRKHAGLIAQDVKSVLPEVIHENNEGYLTVAYGNLISLLVEAIKEIDDRLSKLEKK